MGVLMDSRARIFNQIYATNAWRGEDGTRSGPGSTLPATELIREALPRKMEELGVRSVLDVACGDGFWQPELPGYIGADIAASALEAAQARHPDRNFVLLDAVVDELPRTDAVLTRDTMQHLSLVDGLAMLNNIRRSGARWLFASTHRGGTNVNIRTGDWYEIDLESWPFLLGPPAWTVFDGVWKSGIHHARKVIGLWRLR
jgi:SAM-dependent methyltransferase